MPCTNVGLAARKSRQLRGEVRSDFVPRSRVDARRKHRSENSCLCPPLWYRLHAVCRRLSVHVASHSRSDARHKHRSENLHRCPPVWYWLLAVHRRLSYRFRSRSCTPFWYLLLAAVCLASRESQQLGSEVGRLSPVCLSSRHFGTCYLPLSVWPPRKIGG